MATAVPEATTSAAAGAESSEPLQLILSNERLDSNELLEHDHLQQHSNCSMCTAESSSFQIRHFVSTVRERDFSKCWPFRQQILDKFLSVGVRPFLPPLKQADSEHALLLLSALKRGILNENEDLSEENNKENSEDALDNCDEQDCDSTNPAAESSDIPASDIKIHSLLNEIKVSAKPIDTEDTSPSTSLDSPRGSERVSQACTDGSDRFSDHSQAGLVDDLLVQKSSDERTDTDHPYLTPCSHSDNVSMKDSNSQSPGQLESEAGSSKVVAADCCDHEDAAVAWREVCTAVNNMADQIQDESCSLKSLNKTSKDVKEVEDSPSPSTEKFSEVQPRAEKSRISEDASFTCPTIDAQLIPKLCPVCLNFTSTSITALNAHIDQCLESVLPTDKLEGRALKNRYKSRKIRSMTDICATAPARTLEDLERTAKQWALNDETVTKNPNVSPQCFLRWEGLLVQRRCRTSLNRNCSSNWGVALIQNLGIKDTVSEVEHAIEYKQKKVEKTSTTRFFPHNEMLRRRSSTRLSHDVDFKSEQPIKDDTEHSIPKPSKSSNMASYSPLEKVSPHKKRKRSGPLTLPPSLKNLQSSEKCFISTEEDDSFWQLSLDRLDFTPIDTSADEEKRLLMMQKPSDLNKERSELKSSWNDCLIRKLKASDRYEQKDSICSTDSQSGKPMAKHQTRVYPSDNEHMNDSPRKRKVTEIERGNSDDDNDGRSAGDDTAVRRHLERSLKNKRIFPKIKSLGTLKDTPGEKYKNRLGEQIEIEKSHVCTTDDESSYNGNVQSKHQSPQYFEKCTHGETDNDEQEQSISSKEHVQSPKSSSITACLVLTEHTSEDHHANHCANEKEYNNRNVLMTKGSKVISRDMRAGVVHEETNMPVAELRNHDILIHMAPKVQELRKVLNRNPGYNNANDFSVLSSNAASGESGIASVETSWRERVLETGTSPISSKKSSIASVPVNSSSTCFVEDLAVLHPIKRQQNFHTGCSHVSAKEISNSLASSGESFPIDSRSLQQLPAGGKERWVAGIERFESQGVSMCNSSVDLGISQDSSKRTNLHNEGQNAHYGKVIGKMNFPRAPETGKSPEGTVMGTFLNSEHSTKNFNRDSSSSKSQYAVGYETVMPGSMAMPALCTQPLSGQNEIYDIRRTMIGKPTWSQDILLPERDFISGKLNTTVQHAPNIHIGSSLNSMPVPVQSIPATVHHQVSSDAFNVIRGRSSNLVCDQGNAIASGCHVSSKHHKPPSTLTICNDIPSVHNRRDTLSASSVSSYGSVEISGDQGYVFKLMGQNVMVTNSNVSSLGDQNGLRGFHPSTSISRLGITQDTHTPYSHMAPQVPSSSQLDAYKSRNSSLPFRSPESHHCALRNIPSKQVGSFQPHMYIDPSARITSATGQISGERVNVLESFQASHSKKPPSIKSNNKLLPEVCNGGFSHISGGPWFQGAIDTRDNSINQPNGRSFPANNSLHHGRELHIQSLMLQYSSSERYPDINKVGLAGGGGGGKLYAPKEQSGTLADIVNCSERSTNWQVPGAMGDCFEAGNQ